MTTPDHIATINQVNAVRLERGLPPLPPPMPIGEFVAWAFKEHDTTLRALAEQEREDAAHANRDLDPICDGDATLYEYGGPLDCPGCSACVPAKAEVTP